MSVGNTIGTAAAVVGVGLAGVVGWKVFEAARAANALNNAARDIRAAEGDQSALDNLITSLRSSGVLSQGREGAQVSQGTNAETQVQSSGVLVAAERAMLAAGSGAALSPNLAVVRPKDVLSNWKLGEGAWLPSQGRLAGWRESPTTLVRGLDMNAYALVYATDVYQPTSYGNAIVAYPASYGSRPVNLIEANNYRRYANVPWATAQGLQNTLDVFLVSSDQEPGTVALWSRAQGKFLTAAEAANVQFAVAGPLPPSFPGIPFILAAAPDERILPTAFIPEFLNALKRKVRFQPFPPTVRGQNLQAAAARIAAKARAKAGA